MRGKVLVVHDDALNEESFKEKNKLFVEAARKNNIVLDFKSNVSLYTYIDNNNVKCHDSYGTYDYAIFFDQDYHLAKNLETMGVKVVNSSRSIRLCENKATMYGQLAKCGISIPKTVILPVMTNFSMNKIYSFLNDAASDLGLPMVVKEWFGDYGKTVYLANTKEQLYSLVEKLQGKELLLQEFIVEASGSDIRLFVIKNKVVAAFRRQGISGDFRSNLALGGTMYNYIPTHGDEELAISATKAMDCDFAIVDILRSINGPVVCEVNTNADVNNFVKCCNVDIPSLLLKSIK